MNDHGHAQAVSPPHVRKTHSAAHVLGSSPKKGPMPKCESAKIKYAIGLFTRNDSVNHALAEMRANDWPAHHIKVIASHEALKRARSSWRRNGGEINVCHWIECRGGEGSCPWHFKLVDPPEAVDPQRINPLPGFNNWAPKRQVRQLHDHLRAGGEVLVVRSSTQPEERTTWTTLLKHADSGVQTHEVSLRQLRA
jgi:hypothetical protein